jgi:YggT family protein
VNLVALIVYYAIGLFILFMWGRFILDIVPMLARQWRPRGFVLVLAEAVYTVTDPPVKALRRVIPPLRAGSVAIDFSWSIVLIAAIIAQSIAGGFTRI